jgi:hypothetical protein
MPEMTNNPARMSPHIEITPRTPLVDERVSIRLLGFAPHPLVTLRASSFDELGNQYCSYALCQTDDSGEVDVGAQQPLAGSYTGRGAMGFLVARADANNGPRAR